MRAVAITIQDQKRALQLKYLLQISKADNKQELVSTLNKIYPFNENPLKSAPPLEFFQTKQQQIITENPMELLQKHSFIIIVGGLVLKKGTHEYMENRYLSLESQKNIIFNLKQGNITLRALPDTVYLKIHNIWLQMAKRNKNIQNQSFIQQKLLNIPFFSNLSFTQYEKFCKAAYIMTVGPGDILLKSMQIPYNMYIVIEGELLFEKKVQFLSDKQLWIDVLEQLPREEDDTCQLMFEHLVKDPKEGQQFFQVLFKVKSVGEKEIICARETLQEEPFRYEIVSSLKTKLICIKYPDFYHLSSEKLNQIRNWPSFATDDTELRKDYYYQLQWNQFKEQIKKQSKLNKLQKQRFEDFLRKAVNLSQQKHYYCKNRVGQGSLIDSPAGKVQKLRLMAYKDSKS